MYKCCIISRFDLPCSELSDLSTTGPYFPETVCTYRSITTLEIGCTPHQYIVHVQFGLGKVPSASSQALPAPNPVPNHTGHALRLNNSTENMTPKEKPSVDRTTREDIARSHCNTFISVTHRKLCPAEWSQWWHVWLRPTRKELRGRESPLPYATKAAMPLQ